MTTRSPARRGSIIPFMAFCSVALFGFVALAIDLGMLMVARSQCQSAADAAALAGARVLDNRYPAGTDPAAYDNRRGVAVDTAKECVQNNPFFNRNYAAAQVSVARAGVYGYDDSAERFGAYFPDSKPSNTSWTAVEVEVNGDQPAYFARVLGISTLPTAARAVAAHRPRDIALVVDMSGSMQFSSSTHWEPGTAGSTDVVYGLLNPDPDYPRFGHYQRFTQYQTASPTKGLATGAVSSRPNPFRMTTSFVGSTGEVFAPNNHTIETPNGPPLVRDFYFDPINRDDPRTPAATVTSFDSLWNAFQRWNPPVVSQGDPNTLTPPTYSWASYSATDTTNTRGPTPAPPSFAEQADSGGVAYVGDRHPRKGGVTSTASWDPTTAAGAAVNLTGLLNPTLGERGIPGTRPAVANGNRTEGGDSWQNFYDDGWERNGYDLNVPNYIGSNYASAAPRSGTPFQGYSMGPGYYGKTFFMWPPDPRWGDPNGTTAVARPDLPSGANPAKDANGNWIADWRRRFFLRGDSPDTGNASGYLYLDPQAADNDPTAAGNQNVNQALLRTTVGHTLRDATSTVGGKSVRNYRINYKAVLAWIRSGPQTLPPNLRAGRVLYYTSIPDNVDNVASDPDQRFWRDYIDFVMGYNGNVTGYDPRYTLAGVENMKWPEGADISISPTSAYTPLTGSANPKPYLNATDNPNRPRMHFWFGPATMLSFLSTRSPLKNWLPGNAHEAQGWQLKVGLQSAIEDVKNNHPNDSIGMVFFGYLGGSTNYTTPRVPVGQDWVTLKNSLFFPASLLPQMKAGSQSAEVRAANAGFGSALLANLPNANGQTDPNTGLALAFNTLRKPAGGGTGRKGAAKIIIFETDGVPNAYQDFTFAGGGETSSYVYGGSGATRGNGDSDVMDRAYDVAKQFTRLTTDGGHSLPNAPARIYPVAFGDLFDSSSGFKQTALTFLQTLAFHGKTSSAASDPLPPTQIITGQSDVRIRNIRDTFERIFQSGVQVTLVE